jgi:mRNA interferase MazF
MKCGVIWLVDLTDAKGHEPLGMRPAIIVGGANGLILVVPLNSSMGSARFSHTLTIPPDSHNGLDAGSVALEFRIVALDRERFQHRIGAKSEQHWLAIVVLIRDLLHLD